MVLIKILKDTKWPSFGNVVYIFTEMILKVDVTSGRVQRLCQTCFKLYSEVLKSIWTQSSTLHLTTCDCTAEVMQASLLVLHWQNQIVKNKSQIWTKYQSKGRCTKLRSSKMGVMFSGMINSCKFYHLDVNMAVLWNEWLYEHKEATRILTPLTSSGNVITLFIGYCIYF